MRNKEVINTKDSTLGKRFPCSWDLLAAKAWFSWSFNLTLLESDDSTDFMSDEPEEFVIDSINWLHEAFVEFWNQKKSILDWSIGFNNWFYETAIKSIGLIKWRDFNIKK